MFPNAALTLDHAIHFYVGVHKYTGVQVCCLLFKDEDEGLCAQLSPGENCFLKENNVKWDFTQTTVWARHFFVSTSKIDVTGTGDPGTSPVYTEYTLYDSIFSKSS